MCKLESGRVAEGGLSGGNPGVTPTRCLLYTSEMTRIIWKMIKDELLLPYVDLKTEYYDLGPVSYTHLDVYKRQPQGRCVCH